MFKPMTKYTLKLPKNYKRKSLPFYREWLAALKSDEYNQGEGSLVDGKSYCCLGVLSKIQGRLKNRRDGNSSDACTGVLSDDNPCYKVFNRAGEFPSRVKLFIADDTIDALTGCNDNGLTFKQIATIISRVWKAETKKKTK